MIENHWMNLYRRDGASSDRFSGRVWEPIRLLEHEVTTNMWGRKEKCFQDLTGSFTFPENQSLPTLCPI
jgi:hypothetical protein